MEGRIICSKCGSSIQAGAKFCDVCGTKVEHIANVIEPVAAAVKEPVEAVQEVAATTVGVVDAEIKEVKTETETKVNEGIQEVKAETAAAAAVAAAGVAEAQNTVNSTAAQAQTAVNNTAAQAQTAAAAAGYNMAQQPYNGQPPYMQQPYGAPAPAPAPAPGKPEKPKKEKKGVGVGGMILIAIFSLIEIVSLFACTIISAFTLLGNESVLDKVANAKDSGIGFLDSIAGLLPTVSNFVYVGIMGVIFLIFAVLIFILSTRRPSVAFKTIGIDMMIVSLFTAFGILFVDTYGGELGALNLDCKLFEALRTYAAEWLLILTAGLIVAAVIFFIIAGIIEGARYRKAVKAAKAAGPQA